MKKILLTLGGLVVIGASTAVFYSNYYKPKGDVVTPTQGQSDDGIVLATSSPEKPAEKPIVIDSTPKYKGQDLNFLASPKELSGYPKEFVEAQQKKLLGIIKLVNENPKDETNWIDVGLVKKVFNNYIGARDVWEYAKLLNPNASMSYSNLGKLYSGYLSDNKKAEENFLAALKLDPGISDGYLALAEFYRDFYKEKFDQVDDVLLAGIKVVPLDLNLHLQLAFYYKNIGDKENAIKYFEKFLKLPDLTGAQQKAIEEEVVALKS
ncbi:MAG: hypothetical protein Q7S83_03445 [bacterium]|nr:hypothetical protein [bacterium]